MQYTDNYSLRLPQGGEKVKRDDINYNTNAVDGIMADNRKISLQMYDENSTYDAGEIRGHESSGRIKAYKCNTDNTTGVWDSTKWDETDLATEIELAASSGGTTVVANPSGTATDTLNTVQIGNEIFDIEGGGSGSGAYIDTDNVIQSQTSIPADTDVSYTATQNCCVVFALISAATNSAKAEVDGVKIHEQFASSQTLQFSSKCILKKGQTIVFRQSYSQGDGNYIVYGITYTSPNLQPIVYSTEEREVGVWTDGKPLYQNTLVLPSAVNLSASTWTNSGCQVSNIDIIPRGTVIRKDSEGPWTISVGYDSQTGDVQLYSTAAISLSADSVIILQYTKTTDTAGSGTWTPQGVPAVHYSTDEKVVGTWIDGSTLYAKSYHVSTVTSTYATVDSTITCTNAKIRNCSMGTITVGGAYNDAQYVDGRMSQSQFVRVILNTGGLTVGIENPPSDPVTDFDFTIQYTKVSS